MIIKIMDKEIVKPDTVSESLDNFESFIDNDFDITNGELNDIETYEDLANIVKHAIAQFLMKDEKSWELIKTGEQILLEKWSK